MTKHITRRELIVRERDEREAASVLRVTKISTLDNLADMFTKVLDRIPFTKFKRLVLNILAMGASWSVPRKHRAT